MMADSHKMLFYFSGLKITFSFKDKELNKIAAFFNVLTFLLTCAALVQPSWFRIKGLHCTQSLSLTQFFSFDEDGDDDDDQIMIHQNDFDPINRSDFNGKEIIVQNYKNIISSVITMSEGYLLTADVSHKKHD